MVRLGIVKDRGQLPAGFISVLIRPADAPADSQPGESPGELAATVNGKPGARGELDFELFLDAPSSPDKVEAWSRSMAEKLLGMRLDRFCLRADTLAQALKLPLSEALKSWGFPFFQHYDIEAQVLMQVGENRMAAVEAMAAWQIADLPTQLDPELDFDAQARQQNQCWKSAPTWPLFRRAYCFLSSLYHDRILDRILRRKTTD